MAELSSFLEIMVVLRSSEGEFVDDCSPLLVMTSACESHLDTDSLIELAVETGLAKVLSVSGIGPYLDRLELPSTNSSEAGVGKPFAISLLPEDRRQAFQRQMLGKVLQALLVASGKQSNAAEVCNMIGARPDEFFLCDRMRDLKTPIATFGNPATAASAECIDDALTALQGEHSGLRDILSFGATAKVMIGLCEARRREIQRETESARALSAVKLPEGEVENMAPGVVALPNVKEWIAARYEVKKIMATAPASFAESPQYKAVVKKFEAAAEALEQRFEHVHKGQLLKLIVLCSAALGEIDSETVPSDEASPGAAMQCEGFGEQWATDMPDYAAVGISHVVLGSDEVAKNKFSEKFELCRKEITSVVAVVAEIRDKSNPYDFAVAVLENFFNANAAISGKYQDANDIVVALGGIKQRILDSAEVKLIEKMPSSIGSFASRVVNKTFFDGAPPVLETADDFSVMCDFWLRMFQNQVPDNKEFSIKGVAFGSMLVCLCPKLHQLFDDADTRNGQDWLKQIEAVAVHKERAKKFTEVWVDTPRCHMAEENRDALRCITTALTQRLGDAELAVFNQCERDCLTTIDSAMEIMAADALRECMEPVVFKSGMPATVVEFAKTAEMKQLAPLVCASFDKFAMYSRVATFMKKDIDNNIKARKAAMSKHFDGMTILHTLGRQRNKDETMANLAVRCWQKVKVDLVAPCLKMELEKHIPLPLLLQLRPKA